jgi:hypothetical protein
VLGLRRGKCVYRESLPNLASNIEFAGYPDTECGRSCPAPKEMVSPGSKPERPCASREKIVCVKWRRGLRERLMCPKKGIASKKSVRVAAGGDGRSKTGRGSRGKKKKQTNQRRNKKSQEREAHVPFLILSPFFDSYSLEGTKSESRGRAPARGCGVPTSWRHCRCS